MLSIALSPGSNSRECDGFVDTTPTCTRADAHFIVRTSHYTIPTLIRTFPMWAHSLGLKVKGIWVSHLFATRSQIDVMSLSEGSLGRFPLFEQLALSRPSASSTSLA